MATKPNILNHWLYLTLSQRGCFLKGKSMGKSQKPQWHVTDIKNCLSTYHTENPSHVVSPADSTILAHILFFFHFHRNTYTFGATLKRDIIWRDLYIPRGLDQWVTSEKAISIRVVPGAVRLRARCRVAERFVCVRVSGCSRYMMMMNWRHIPRMELSDFYNKDELLGNVKLLEQRSLRFFCEGKSPRKCYILMAIWGAP